MGLKTALSELLHDDVLESESNKNDRYNKSNRVDLKIKNNRGKVIIIELQYEREHDYLQRLLYGTAKIITEHMTEGQPYSCVVKTISVNIPYFDLGQGSDYIYRETTHFKELHTNDGRQKEAASMLLKRIRRKQFFSFSQSILRRRACGRGLDHPWGLTYVWLLDGHLLTGNDDGLSRGEIA
ncbi:MAG: Rpn family recombination-promoting nuclease/putative transposase [Magnetococcus sp. DMHC-6]